MTQGTKSEFGNLLESMASTYFTSDAFCNLEKEERKIEYGNFHELVDLVKDS